MKVSIILPAYNEELSIRETLLDFHRLNRGYQIFVIDNNSSDNTLAIASETFKKHKIAGAILREKRQGKGNAVRMAFQEIDSDIYVLADADCTYPASDLQKLIQPVLTNQADMVVGDRHLTGAYRRENKRSFHNFGNTLVKRIINFLFNAQLSDIMSGYRVFNRKFIRNFPILSCGFEIESEMTLHALDKRFRIVEIPVEYKNRPKGSFSKLKTFRDGFRVLRTIASIFRYYRPFTFFGLISIFFFLSGLVSGFPVVDEFYRTKLVLHIPLAILTMGLMVMSLVSFSIGIILDTIVKFHKFNYELALNKYVENQRKSGK